MRIKWNSVAMLLVLGLLAGAVAMAGQAKTHDMTVTVSSVNVKEKTITFKDADGKEATAPVMESALASLKNTKAGEKVVLTCQDDENGKHEGVTKIAPAKA